MNAKPGQPKMVDVVCFHSFTKEVFATRVFLMIRASDGAPLLITTILTRWAVFVKVRYRKLPHISAGLAQLRQGFLDWLIKGATYISEGSCNRTYYMASSVMNHDESNPAL